MTNRVSIFIAIGFICLLVASGMIMRESKLNDYEDKSNSMQEQTSENKNESEDKEKEEKTESETNLQVTSNGGVIYLTFDDGPSLENTPKILDVLKDKNVQATFFINNYPDKLEYIVKRQYAEGHTIGLHGYSHVYSDIYTSADAVMNNFYLLQEKVSKTTGGYTSKIIRFPGGSSNTVSKKYCRGVMSAVTKRALQEGFTYFDWNVSSGDAGNVTSKDADKIYNNIISTLTPGKENVVLMHDSEGHSATRDIVEKVIEFGKQNGYEFKAITEETIPVRHGVNN